MESELHDMVIRFICFFLLFSCILTPSFPSDPYIKIVQKLEKNDPVLSSTMTIFIQDVTKDSTQEIIIQNNYKFAVYELDLENESLVLQKRFTLSPIQLGKGPHYFCFGCLEPDTKDVLLILTPNALFKKDLNVQDDDGSTTPEKIMDCVLYPQEKQATRIDFVDFAIDIEGDGYDELFLPKEDEFGLYKKNEREIREIPLPRMKNLCKTVFNANTSYVNFWNMKNQLLDITSSGDSKPKSLVFYPKNQGERVKNVIHIYKPCIPLSFRKAPDQEIIIKKERTARYELFQMICDIDNDGFVDVIRGESNLNILSPLTIIKLYKALPLKRDVLERPDQQVRLKDQNGIFFIDDFSGDGFIDFCLLQFDYNPSSTDDIVEFYVNNYTRYRLDFHYYDPEISGYSSIPKVSFSIRIKRSVNLYRNTKESIILDGDFNGDGFKDILALVSPDRGEIYIQDSKGFNKKPYATFNAHNAMLFDIEDIDGGGIDDIVLISMKEKILSLYLFR